MTWEIQRTKQGLQRAAKQHSNPQAAEFLRSYDANLHTDPESAIRGANTLLQSLSVDTADVADKRASFFPSLLRLLFDRLEHGEEVSLCARIVDLLTGLLTQLSTRRYLIVLVEDWHVAARIRLSSLCRDVLLRAVERLEYFIGFEMDEISGRALEDAEAVEQFYHRIMVFQNVVFKYFPSKLEELCLTSVQRLTSREFLLAQLDLLSEEELRALGVHLRLVPPVGKEVVPTVYSKALLLEIFAQEYANRQDRVQQINSLPLLPDEEILWNKDWVSVCRGENLFNSAIVALPTLNLQFLSLQDYLLRNFELYRMEAYDQIRSDLTDAIHRVRARLDMSGETAFTGQSRMAVPVVSFSLTEVRRAAVGEDLPGEVCAEVTFSLHGLRGEARKAWEALHAHDVLFLVKIQATNRDATEYSYGTLVRRDGVCGSGVEKEGSEKWSDADFLQKEGVVTVRSCEVIRMEDEDHIVLNEISEPDTRLKRAGKRRLLQVRLDPSIYQTDMERVAAGAKDPYEGFNLLVRRDPASNNFKAVLETTRDLLNVRQLSAAIPEWLHDVLLGIGDPWAAHFSRCNPSAHSLDFVDTFRSAEHVVAAFPRFNVEFRDKNGDVQSVDQVQPPFRLTFPSADEFDDGDSDEFDDGDSAPMDSDRPTLVCTAYAASRFNPYTPSELLQEETWKPSVEFTAKQVEAIRSGMEPGVTLIVGPPGTGKTDVAVQIVSNLYHNYPEQRILVVTHSNHALNDLFAKIAERDVEKRHLLRLGHGERDLDSIEDFSRLGRVDYCLRRREILLKVVQRLAESMGYLDDVAYSCETSEHFATTAVLPRVQTYLKALEQGCSDAEKAELCQVPASFTKEQRAEIARWDEENDSEAGHLFPFKRFFASHEGAIFPGSLSLEEQERRGKLCMRSIRDVFNELKEYRAFELLRNGRHRTDYILTNQARIVAMTCTHAAIARQRFLESEFTFDTLVVEEAGQILELESFIPFLLQEVKEGEGCRLKRVVYLGDANQLPPIVQSPVLAHIAHLDQSLFARLLRLGVPSIQLDAQGRCRASLAKLFSWRYADLRNLAHAEVEFKRANACLRYEYQMIDVEGEESEPMPHVLQNRAEAEFVVALYQYLRLCGYPGERITLLTPYNGQRELLRELLKERCRKNPLFGMPRKVTTVDKYQGQQNDIVLLSLVRTRKVGYLRDVRRLLVAVSRARLGLYVFGKVSLFRDCFELRNIVQLLLQRPCSLQLVENEYYPCERGVEDDVPSFEVKNAEHLGQIVAQYYEIRRQQWEAMQREMEVEE